MTFLLIPCYNLDSMARTSALCDSVHEEYIMMENAGHKVYLLKEGDVRLLDSSAIEISSMTLEYGTGLSKSMRVYSSIIPFFDEHLERLKTGADFLGMTMALEGEEIAGALQTIMGEQSLDDGTLTILFPAEHSFEIRSCVIIVSPKVPCDEALYTRGSRGVILDWKKNSASRISRVPTLNRLEDLLAWREAKKLGYDEAILLNEKGNICQGSFSNIFFIKGKVIYTPSPRQGAIPGVTREKVIAIAIKEGMKVYEGKVSTSRIKDVHEAFLASSQVEIMPLVEIGKTKVGKGIPGERTHRLHALYRKELEEEINRRKETIRSEE